MIDESPATPENAELRRGAEARLKGRLPQPDTADRERLLHELRVHQIELEIQNEELREARQQLEAELQRFTELYDFAPMGLFTLDRRGTILATNFAGASLLGLERGRLVNAAFGFFVIEQDRPAFQAFLAKVVAGPGKQHCELTLQPEQGPTRIVTIEAILSPDQEEYRCVVLDMTEHRQLQQQLLRAQRLESIGTLAGGIAHDLNNTLTPIMVAADLLKTRAVDPSDHELLAMIDRSAGHAAALTRQVLTFARGSDGERLPVSLRSLIRDIELLTNETFLKHIAIVTRVPADLWAVTGDPTEIHQVLLNLCVNARDAMPGGGTLTITAENRTLDALDTCLSLEARPGRYVVLQVEDTGTGMTPEVLDRIFDPFFTTKQFGQGTGLGLAIVLGIVKGHEGLLQVASEPGQGAKFSIYLPAASEPEDRLPSGIEAERPRGRGELILVVDDEPMLRTATIRTLEAFGYRTVAASNGVEAVATYASHQDEIAVVLTDMMMPVMDGPATIRALHGINPRLPIIATSGVSTSDQDAMATSLGARCLLAKPYTTSALLCALRDTLAP